MGGDANDEGERVEAEGCTVGTGRNASRRVDGMGVACISPSADGRGLTGIGMHVGSEDSPI